jgi:uncharacterized protein (TIGR00251 family)
MQKWQIAIRMLDALHKRLLREGSLTLTLRVRPKAGRSEIRSVDPDGTLRVDVKALPEDGEANAQVIEVLADAFGVARSTIAILSGHRGRTKIMRIGDPPRSLARCTPIC